MKIDNYVEGAFRELVWWLDQLQDAGIDAVRATAAGAGAKAIRAMLREQENDIRDLIVSPAAVRAATLARLSTRDRHLTLLAGAYIVRSGHAWLQAAAETAADPSIDVHPVTMLLRAHHAWSRLGERHPALWPIDDGTDPFQEEPGRPA